jgi:hypothetical protein
VSKFKEGNFEFRSKKEKGIFEKMKETAWEVNVQVEHLRVLIYESNYTPKEIKSNLIKNWIDTRVKAERLYDILPKD